MQIVYFTQLPEELRDYTDERAAAAIEALTLGFQLGR